MVPNSFKLIFINSLKDKISTMALELLFSFGFKSDQISAIMKNSFCRTYIAAILLLALPKCSTAQSDTKRLPPIEITADGKLTYNGYHAFSVGFTAPGPNAFVQCYSYLPSNFSGAIRGWVSGVLFDKMTVDGGSISMADREVDGQGGGWSAANSMCRQCRAAQLRLPSPPTAQNRAYGSWAQGYGSAV